MESGHPVSLSEKDYLSILELIHQLNTCQTLEKFMLMFEAKVLPLVEAHAGLFAHVEPEIASCEVMKAINIPSATIKTFQEWAPNSQISIMASTSNRPVVAYGVDRNINELNEEVETFLKAKPEYQPTDFSYDAPLIF